jgi:hypothetical protein
MSTEIFWLFRKCRILREIRINSALFCVYECPSKEEEIKHENQQQKQESEPIFTISTLRRRSSVYVKHTE